MIEVVNRQRIRRMDLFQWQEFAGKVIALTGKSEQDATIAFVSNRQMRRLNKRFRGIDKVTDVLSFPVDNEWALNSLEPNLGDIAISVERAATQAAENGLDYDSEIAQLILHGLLHLCGYDHETDRGEMNRVELRLRRQLQI